MTDYQYQPLVISGTINGSGQTSSAVQLINEFSVCVGGTFNATVLLERSPDEGINYFPCSTDATGTPASYTAPMSVDVMSLRHGMLYRLRCTAYSSGTITWVIWQ